MKIEVTIPHADIVKAIPFHWSMILGRLTEKGIPALRVTPTSVVIAHGRIKWTDWRIEEKTVFTWTDET